MIIHEGRKTTHFTKVKGKVLTDETIDVLNFENEIVSAVCPYYLTGHQ